MFVYSMTCRNRIMQAFLHARFFWPEIDVLYSVVDLVVEIVDVQYIPFIPYKKIQWCGLHPQHTRFILMNISVLHINSKMSWINEHVIKTYPSLSSTIQVQDCKNMQKSLSLGAVLIAKKTLQMIQMIAFGISVSTHIPNTNKQEQNMAPASGHLRNFLFCFVFIQSFCGLHEVVHCFSESLI